MTGDRRFLEDALGGTYAIERELGRGGMATVYLVHDGKHDRRVALKVLLPQLAQSLGTERFLREIRTAAWLQYPRILGVHDSGEASGQLWFTMPFVEGESLRNRLRRERQLPVDEALRIVREAARALDYAHAHGVIHRDIKPENILLTKDGSTMIADFGIARSPGGDGDALTQTGFVRGTPAYMSPEQASGDKAIDGRSDVYGLAAVRYELLTGVPPFTGESAQAVIEPSTSGSACAEAGRHGSSAPAGRRGTGNIVLRNGRIGRNVLVSPACRSRLKRSAGPAREDVSHDADRSQRLRPAREMVRGTGSAAARECRCARGADW